MSEIEKPKAHPEIEIANDQIRLTGDDGLWSPLTPDEAVALGYALFEHGLYLKGRMKPQPPTEGTKP